jgi:hypothetical protein
MEIKVRTDPWGSVIILPAMAGEAIRALAVRAGMALRAARSWRMTSALVNPPIEDPMLRRTIDVEERLPLLQTLPLSLQHLFAMFGATVLVPFLFHVNPATSLLMNGVGTLLYLWLCKGRIPAYLGSSFAFIAPVLAVMAIPSLGYAAAQGGFIAFVSSSCS